MLYYIITVLILSTLLLYQYFIFIRIYYIGQSLHKFRELRSEVTLFLSANVKNGLTLKEALEYHHFLLSVDGIIKHFDTLKTELTSFKSLRTVYSKILFSSEKLAPHAGSTYILYQYKGKVSECILTALKAIPLFRPRLLFFFLKILATLAIKLGIKRFSKLFTIVERLYNIEKNINKNKSVPCNTQA
jgi:hypothetical protein